MELGKWNLALREIMSVAIRSAEKFACKSTVTNTATSVFEVMFDRLMQRTIVI
jgi:hypothetical protein